MVSRRREGDESASCCSSRPNKGGKSLTYLIRTMLSDVGELVGKAFHVVLEGVARSRSGGELIRELRRRLLAGGVVLRAKGTAEMEEEVSLRTWTSAMHLRNRDASLLDLLLNA